MSERLKPRLIVVAGPNGAGKTSITEQLLRHEWMGGCVYVNPDYIARDKFGDWNAPDAVIKAAIRAAEIREQCVQDGRDGCRTAGDQVHQRPRSFADGLSDV